MLNLLDQAIEATNTQANEVSPVLETNEHFNGDKFDLFTVQEKPLFSDYGKIEGKKGLFVNGENINIVSDRYECHQPLAIAKQFEKAMRENGLQINRVLPNPKNGGLLLSAKYANQVLGGDNTDINLTFYTSHDGKYKTFLSLDTLRLACYNQLPVLYKNKSRFIFSEKHYKNALDIELIGQFLAEIPSSIQAHNDKLETLKETRLNLTDLVDLFVDHYKLKKEQKQYQSKIDNFKSIYYNASGQDIAPHNSAYKALQAITFRNTHETRNTAMIEENRLIKNGNDSLVWLDNLLELAA